MYVSLHSEKPKMGKNTEVNYKGYADQPIPMRIIVEINGDGTVFNIELENSSQINFPRVKKCKGVAITHAMIFDNEKSLIIPLDRCGTISRCDKLLFMSGTLNLKIGFDNIENDITESANEFIKKLFNAVQKI